MTTMTTITAVTPQPVRWRWYWLHHGMLYTDEELLERFDYHSGEWHERPVAVPGLTPRRKDRYLEQRLKG